MTSFALPAFDGVPLAVYYWPTDGAVKSVVQIIHGLAEHAGRYDEIAQILAAAGHAVYAHDLRGHGRTAASTEELGSFGVTNGWEVCLDDIAVVRQHIERTHAGAPVILLGHSMGSFLAQQFAARKSQGLAALVLSGSNLESRLMLRGGSWLARLEKWRLGSRAHSALLRALTFTAYNRPFAQARTAFDWLSRDAAAVNRYVADPYCGFEPTTQFWIDLLEGMAARSPVPREHLPIYLISGDRDSVSANGRRVKRLQEHYRKLGITRLTLRLYPGARHELFHETNRKEVFQDLVDWIEATLNHS